MIFGDREEGRWGPGAGCTAYLLLLLQPHSYRGLGVRVRLLLIHVRSPPYCSCTALPRENAIYDRCDEPCSNNCTERLSLNRRHWNPGTAMTLAYLTRRLNIQAGMQKKCMCTGLDIFFGNE